MAKRKRISPKTCIFAQLPVAGLSYSPSGKGPRPPRRLIRLVVQQRIRAARYHQPPTEPQLDREPDDDYYVTVAVVWFFLHCLQVMGRKNHPLSKPVAPTTGFAFFSRSRKSGVVGGRLPHDAAKLLGKTRGTAVAPPGGICF